MKKSLLLLLALLAIPLTGQGISRKEFFAEIVNRSNVHQKVKSLDKGLSSRDLFSYAFFVCESETNLDQLDDIFKHAARMQDRDKTSAGYGNYRWSWRDGLVMDFNAVEFCMETGALIWILHRDKSDEGEAVAEEPSIPEITCEPGKVYAPIKGNVIPSADIPDETFAAGVLGEGVGIEPEEGVVYAPFDGEISSTTDTRHAIGISSPDGMELLIHVGVNTVAMEGDGFELFCAEGDQVRAGQKLMTFDIDKIKAAGYSTTTAVLVTNSDDYPGLEIHEGGCDPLDCVITLSKEESEEPTEV